MYYPDLHCECQIARGPRLRAIGWLAAGHPFATGVTPGLVERLADHLSSADRWLPVMSFGVHFCEFCSGGKRIGGSQNLIVPHRERIYVAPELVLHYVRDHGYRPPEEFVRALMECPPQGSAEYLNLVEPYRAYFGAK